MSRPQIVDLILADFGKGSEPVEKYIVDLEQELYLLKQGLSEHDADAIDETIKYMQKHYPSLCVDGVFTGGWLKALRKRANQLRQKAHKEAE